MSPKGKELERAYAYPSAKQLAGSLPPSPPLDFSPPVTPLCQGLATAPVIKDPASRCPDITPLITNRPLADPVSCDLSILSHHRLPGPLQRLFPLPEITPLTVSPVPTLTEAEACQGYKSWGGFG